MYREYNLNIILISVINTH